MKYQLFYWNTGSGNYKNVMVALSIKTPQNSVELLIGKLTKI